jgi:Smr domain
MIVACEKGGQQDSCERLYVQGCAEGALVHSLDRDSNNLDLHGLCGSVARTAIGRILTQMRTGECEVQDLVIITGRGNHVLADGRRGVLLQEVEEHLSVRMGIPARPVASNDGRLILRAGDIKAWLETVPSVTAGEPVI